METRTWTSRWQLWAPGNPPFLALVLLLLVMLAPIPALAAGEPVPSETWVIWVVLAFEGVVGVAAIAMMFGWYKTSTSAMKERLERVESRQDTGEHRLTGFATREDLQGLREEIQEVKTGNARLDEKLDKLLDVMGARHV